MEPRAPPPGFGAVNPPPGFGVASRGPPPGFGDASQNVSDPSSKKATPSQKNTTPERKERPQNLPTPQRDVKRGKNNQGRRGNNRQRGDRNRNENKQRGGKNNNKGTRNNNRKQTKTQRQNQRSPSKQKNYLPKKNTQQNNTPPKETFDLQPEMEPEQNPFSAESADGVMCIICCDVIKYFPLGECNHTGICLECSIRLRVLFKNNKCSFCNAVMNDVVITPNSEKKFQDFNLKTLPRDTRSGTYYENEDTLMAIRELWRFNCQKCKSHFPKLGQLKQHTRQEHHMNYCNLCLKHKNVFMKEQVLYTASELRAHLSKTGDHPYCEFCRQQYYDSDMLFKHFREVHYTCFLCEKRGIQFQYFNNYQHLESHYDRCHFFCHDATCRKKRFVVFESKNELQAHEVKEHLSKSGLSRSELRSRRVLDINFTFSGNTQFRPDERDPMRDEPTSNSPITLDRTSVNLLANNPQLAPANIVKSTNSSPVTNSTSATNRTRTNLVGFGASPKKAPAPALSVRDRNRNLMRALKEYLGRPESFANFRRMSGEFKTGAITPKQYFERFKKLFGTNAKSQKLFKELVDLLPDQQKKMALIKLYQATIRKAPAKRSPNNGRAPKAPVPSSSRPLTTKNYGDLLRPKGNLGSQNFPTLAPPKQPKRAVPKRSMGMPKGNWGASRNAAHRLNVSAQPARTNIPQRKKNKGGRNTRTVFSFG